METKKRKPIAEMYKVGDVIELEMQEPSVGKMPVGRTAEGIICVIMRDTKGYWEYGSLWSCVIEEIHDTKLIITPVLKIRGAKEQAQFVAEYAQLLPLKFKSEEPPQPKAKQKKPAAYLSKQELLQLKKSNSPAENGTNAKN